MIIQDLNEQVRKANEEKEKKQPTKTLEGYGAWLRNKYVNSSG